GRRGGAGVVHRDGPSPVAPESARPADVVGLGGRQIDGGGDHGVTTGIVSLIALRRDIVRIHATRAASPRVGEGAGGAGGRRELDGKSTGGRANRHRGAAGRAGQIAAGDGATDVGAVGDVGDVDHAGASVSDVGVGQVVAQDG